MSKLQTTYSKSVRDQIEKDTQGQWRNKQWYKHKQGAITASKFGLIRRVLNGASLKIP